MDTITLVLAMLATARLTRLVTTDRITAGPRSWLITRLPEESLISYLVVCDWCVSVYTGALVAGSWWLWGGHTWYTVLMAALALSYAAGFLAQKENE